MSTAVVNTFLQPSSTLIIAKTKYTINGQQNVLILDDVQHISFSTPTEQKPVLQLGTDKAVGYSTGQKLNAGTLQLHISQQPSLIRLFDDWIKVMNKQFKNEKMDVVSFDPTDLLPFDMAVFSMPEKLPNKKFYATCYVIDNAKIVEVDVDISAINNNQPIMLYRFVQKSITHKMVLIDPTGVALDMSELFNVFEKDQLPVVDGSSIGTKFSSLILQYISKQLK